MIWFLALLNASAALPALLRLRCVACVACAAPFGEGMRVVVDAVIEALPQLLAVIVLVLFSFLLFGIMGVNFFSGLLSARCRLTPWPVTDDWKVRRRTHRGA